MLKTIKLIFSFLQIPDDKKSGLNIIKTFLSGLIIIFLISLICHFLAEILGRFGLENPFTNLHSNEQIILNKYGLPALIGILLLMPLVEETIFRLPLRPKFIHNALSCILLIGIIIANFLAHKEYTSQLIFIGFSLLVLINLWLNRNRFRLLVYFSAILFGLMHILNFLPLNFNSLGICMVLIIPQIFVGLMLSYIRIKCNFWLGCLFHIIFNLPHIIILLIKFST
ncbi:type II CAAX prenyl endopeptidase Rce1 family protein [Pedobacter sp. GR22-10]|uniref:CPBP family glutamic-type intramembrane protease n=1 Tax=Pedobacter sp. GR22-10 TaxID=2994472 RepID=UPI0022486411|nr:CPBP family glutamic-type intramembrane protease [Pedobacter sp. GR22-10]MCX2432650.1 CPBP family glutamic-type intramembrane protease [Pedobacter sp. GR22-10]